MSYFSRLTDIVTCNLSQLLDEAADPHAAIEQIIHEMEEGLSGASRSVATATGNEDRLYGEIQQHRYQASEWAGKAREQVQAGREADARQSLLRKREVEDLVAGLQQQHQSAVATREHLSTMQRALEARMAEALRKRAALRGEDAGIDVRPAEVVEASTFGMERHSQVDAELEALKRELAGGGRA
ncbi:MAG TPA: PspA/IM30 family protein [Planctomycetaceae bacterium]|nr:PspA/IM30 family protein [Planctomycetaceae bacterium]